MEEDLLALSFLLEDEPSENLADLLEDYEECGDCGYDHGYEPEESYRAHSEE